MRKRSTARCAGSRTKSSSAIAILRALVLAGIPVARGRDSRDGSRPIIEAIEKVADRDRRDRCLDASGRRRNACRTAASSGLRSCRSRSKATNGHHRRRRSFHRPHLSRGDGCDRLLWPAGAHSIRRPDRSRPSRAADPRRLRREKSPDRAGRTGARCAGEYRCEPDGVWLIKEANDVSATAARWTRKDLVGPARALRGGDQFRPRYRRRLQASRHARGQESPGAAGQNADQFLHRAEHAHPHFLRARRQYASAPTSINISASASSLTKGETLKDTAKILEANHADIIVLRHSSAGAPQFLAERLERQRHQCRRRRARASHAGPARPLHDPGKKGAIAGLHVAIIGDILFSRVARSNIFRAPETGRAGHAGRAEHPGAARIRAARRDGVAQTRRGACRPPMWSICSASSTNGNGRNTFPGSANTSASLA